MAPATLQMCMCVAGMRACVNAIDSIVMHGMIILSM